MEPIALFLTVLAFVLAAPAPMLLHRSSLATRAPRAVMVLWQAIALAGGLSLVGAPIIYGLSPFGTSLPEALVTASRLTISENYIALDELEVHPWHIFALCLGLLLGGHLLLTLSRTFGEVLSSRRRHRQLVELLSTPLRHSSDETPPGFDQAHIIQSDAPLAYCLPGRTNARSVTVLSSGLLDQLEPKELAAVVAHERAHLTQRHHLLTMAFEAWYRALPWLPTTRYGKEAVAELTEMLADDGALARHARKDLIHALALSTPETNAGGATDEPHAEANTTAITGPRLQRLLTEPPPLTKPVMGLILLASMALLAVPTGLLLLS